MNENEVDTDNHSPDAKLTLPNTDAIPPESEQEKSHQTVASSPDEAGGNQLQSDSDLLESTQQPEAHHTIINSDEQVDASEMVEESGLTQARDSPPEGEGCLIASLTAIIHRHIACNHYQALTVALWIIMTWCKAAFKVSPILAITAMTKEAGKTQLLTLVEYLCSNPLKTSNITVAALYRSIEEFKPTLLIDEADSFLKGNEDMRGVINTGFEVNGYIIRCDPVTFKPVRFNTFCPKAIAGIGNLPDTIQDRSISIRMCRKRKGEEKVKLRRADISVFNELQQHIQQWSTEHLAELAKAEPEMPNGLSDRKEDCWEPLLAIADVYGGEYPELARKAALAIAGTEHSESHINEQLLLAIKSVFEKQKVVRLPSAELLEHLLEDDEAPWLSFDKGKSMTIRQLAQQLKPFGISSKTIRVGGNKTLKGYDLADFEAAFKDHLPDYP